MSQSLQRNPIRIIWVIATNLLFLLLVIGFVLSLIASDPMDTAKTSAVGKGWHQEELSPLVTKRSNHPFGGSAHVELNGRGHDEPKVIRVDLVRPAYSTNWRVSACKEMISDTPDIDEWRKMPARQ